MTAEVRDHKGRRLLVYVDGERITDHSAEFITARNLSGKLVHVYFQGRRLRVEAIGSLVRGDDAFLVRLVSDE